MDPNVRVQTTVEAVLGNLDKNKLRPLRREAFLCSAKCCENKTSTPEQLQQCISSCEGKIGAVEQVITAELEQFQQRLQRCAMTCSDRAQEQFPADPSKQTPELIERLQSEAAACANKCVDTHLASLNKVNERVEATLKQL